MRSQIKSNRAMAREIVALRREGLGEGMASEWLSRFQVLRGVKLPMSARSAEVTFVETHEFFIDSMMRGTQLA